MACLKGKFKRTLGIVPLSDATLSLAVQEREMKHVLEQLKTGEAWGHSAPFPIKLFVSNANSNTRPTGDGSLLVLAGDAHVFERISTTSRTKIYISKDFLLNSPLPSLPVKVLNLADFAPDIWMKLTLMLTACLLTAADMRQEVQSADDTKAPPTYTQRRTAVWLCELFYEVYQFICSQTTSEHSLHRSATG